MSRSESPVGQRTPEAIETESEQLGEFIVPADSDIDPVLSVVMPTLNEEEGIVECIDRIKRAVDRLEVPAEILISDSSIDRTPELAREGGAIVYTPDEPGYGYAYRYAFERARGDYIAIGDADTTYDFTELPKLYDLVAHGDADMAIGSRLDGEIKDGAMPALHQYVGNPLLTRFLNVFYDAGVSDAHSGFRVISRDALDQLDLQTNGMEFASEMIMRAGARGLDIREVPITYHERTGEATLESFRDGWRHVRFMLLNAPGYLFSIPGTVLAVLGLLLMGFAFADVPVGGITPGANSMVAGSLLSIIGYQIVSLGVFASITSDPIQRPKDPLSTSLVEGFRLEYAATIGLIVFALGVTYAVFLLSQWLASGRNEPLVMEANLLAFTAIVLGLQTLFGAFYMSTIVDG